jgi:hypothetical protein
MDDMMRVCSGVAGREEGDMATRWAHVGVAQYRRRSLCAQKLRTGRCRHRPAVRLGRRAALVDRRESRAAGRERARYPRGDGSVRERDGRGWPCGGRRRDFGRRLLDDDVAVEGELLAVEDVRLAKVEAVEEVLLVDRRLGPGGEDNRTVQRRRGRALREVGRLGLHDGRCGKVHGGGGRGRGGRGQVARRHWGRVRGRQLRLLELLEAGSEIQRLRRQHEAVEVVVLALERHAAPQARAHGRHRGAAGAARIPARACKTDAQAALAPIVEVVEVVRRRRGRGCLQLQAAWNGARQLEVVPPVLVDLDFTRRVLLAQALDGAAEQGRRGHALGDGDARLLRRVDGAVGGEVVVGREQDLPVVVAGVGFGAHRHARGERLDGRVLEEQPVAVLKVAVVPALELGCIGRVGGDGSHALGKAAGRGRHAGAWVWCFSLCEVVVMEQEPRKRRGWTLSQRCRDAIA